MADQVIGNGYISVKPKIDDGFESELQAKGSSGGFKFGNALSVAAGNVIAQAFTKVASAATDAFVQGFNEAANFEQLAGGVEKIFDQANTVQIFEDAKNAYRDLNMSANDYLESINRVGARFSNTMGDQSGYEVARQGMLAIADYASGTGESIEELTQKYGLITRATSSYQSIADQFSSLLPQTKEDFLAQAQAAGFLSGEYKKLSEVPVAEYQKAVTAMLAQSVEQFHLTGNTAAETAGTITGSLAGLSASWSNFLAALFSSDADLGPYVDALGEMLLASFDNIGKVLANFAHNTFGALGGWISQQLESIGINVDEILLSITSAFDAALGEGGIAGAISTVKTNIETTLAPLIEFVIGSVMPLASQVYAVAAPVLATIYGTIFRISTQVLGIVSTVVNKIMAVVSYAWPFIQGVISAATNVIATITSTLWPAISGIVETAVGAISMVIDIAFPIVQKIIETVFEAAKRIADAVWPHISGAVQLASHIINTAVESMRPIIEIVTGIFNSVKEAVETPMGTARDFVDSAVGAISLALESVSDVVGKVTGAFDDIRHGIEDAINGARDAVQGAIETITGIFDGAHFELPHFDLPHFNINGGELPWGIGGKGTPPSISVDWYAKGGIVDGATLIGAGEAGPEMILPREGDLMDDFADRIANRFDGALITWLDRNLGPTIAEYAPSLTRREFDRMARGALA